MAKQQSPQKSLLDVVSPGKKARLYDMLYNHGPGNGTLMFLPIDQGIEHGPRDFFPGLAFAQGYLHCGTGLVGRVGEAHQQPGTHALARHAEVIIVAAGLVV